MTKVFGQTYEIVGVQIWRNVASSFKNVATGDKEVNSSRFHYDNGNTGKERMSLNIFMYLNEVTDKNGPFTYYNPHQSKLINRRFSLEILKYADLRQKQHTQRIESYIQPKKLLCPPGEALLIDNQVCFHRAGYCEEGHRDILEIVCRPT